MSNNCEACCDALDCRTTALETNQLELFSRTDQLREAIELINTGFFSVVTNQAELIAASAIEGNKIIIDGTITLTQSITLLDKTEVWFGEIDYPHISGQSNTCFLIEGADVKIRGVKFNMHQPTVALVTVPGNHASDTWEENTCIKISQDVDCSRLSISDCDFYSFFYGVLRFPRDDAAPFCDDCVIEKCTFKKFYGVGIYIDGKMQSLKVKGNHVRGWDIADTADQTVPTMAWGSNNKARGNGMWIGNQCNYLEVTGNLVCQCDRHGIEHWNDQSLSLGNRFFDISDNNLFSIKGFGLSFMGSLGGNVNRNRLWKIGSYGIELVGDATNSGKLNVCDNILYSVIGGFTNSPDDGSLVTNPNVGIAVNDVQGATISGNYIGSVAFNALASNAAQGRGLQIALNSKNINICNNTFENSGEHMIITGVGATVPQIGLDISNNKFYANSSAHYPPALGFATCIWVIEVDTKAVVKDNTCWAKTGVGVIVSGNPFIKGSGAFAYGGMALNATTVLTGPHNVVGADDSAFWGSNLCITHA